MTKLDLPKSENGSIIYRTTKTTNGHRTRKICGFFVSQISQSLGLMKPENHSEFAVRLISRNKASNRTNKASRLVAVVETVSPLSSDIPFFLTEQLKTMKLFKFITTSTPRLKITIHANSLQEAESKIRWQSKPLCVALNLPVKGGIYA